MGVAVRVLATRVGDGPVGRLIYTAQVIDNALGLHEPPLWTCAHNHQDPQSAYSCAMEWIDKAALSESAPS